jgi:dihydroorotase
VIDPAAGVDGAFDVAVKDGRIAAVAADILPTTAREVIDVKGRLVLPGLIDTHGHVFQYVTGRFGLPPDMVGVQSATTAVIDQGGASCMTFPAYRNYIATPSATHCYAFMSA